MAIRLYCEAHVDRVGFSKSGPLFRFANAIGELILGEPEPFTVDAVRKEFQRIAGVLERVRGLRARSLYTNTLYAQTTDGSVITSQPESDES
jgi:N12 class adenine-specific DNA methylase